MSTVLERAKNDYASKVAAGMRSYAVEEWPDDDGVATVVYWRPATLKERDQIYRVTTGAPTLAGLVETLIVRARNEDGTPMFRQVERGELMRSVDGSVITRIVQAMNESDGQDIESVKNS